MKLKDEIKKSILKSESLQAFGVRMAKENNVYVMTPQYYKIKRDIALELENERLRLELDKVKQAS